MYESKQYPSTTQGRILSFSSLTKDDVYLQVIQYSLLVNYLKNIFPLDTTVFNEWMNISLKIIVLFVFPNRLIDDEKTFFFSSSFRITVDKIEEEKREKACDKLILLNRCANNRQESVCICRTLAYPMTFVKQR